MKHQKDGYNANNHNNSVKSGDRIGIVQDESFAAYDARVDLQIVALDEKEATSKDGVEDKPSSKGKSDKKKKKKEKHRRSEENSPEEELFKSFAKKATQSIIIGSLKKSHSN